jgi:Domain of unknown function (DUF4259)
MGAWGKKTFENDGAMDWLADFLEEPSETRILNAFSAQPTAIQPGLIGKLLGKKAESIPGELEGEEVLAAAEVVAAILGRPSTTLPDELKNPPAISLSPTTVSKALAAIDEIIKDSNLKECWEETDDFQAWKAEVEDLRTRLKRKD